MPEYTLPLFAEREGTMMLRILGNPKRTCTGLTRRESAPGRPRRPVGAGASRCSGGGAAAGDAGKAKSVICLFLFGGWSQFETFDPKPDAPVEVRGPFKSIASSVCGLRVCEHLPLLARRMDRLALVRSVRSDDATTTPA